MICFVKVQSENMKTTWNIRLFIFCMIFSEETAALMKGGFL